MISSREILKRLHGDGWRVDRQNGSHVQLIHPTKTALVTVPHPKKDVRIGTLRSIERQSGLTFR